MEERFNSLYSISGDSEHFKTEKYLVNRFEIVSMFMPKSDFFELALRAFPQSCQMYLK